MDNLGYNLGYVVVVAKDMEIENEDDDEESKNKIIVPKKGLQKLKKLSIEKAKGAVSSACYSAIKKKYKRRSI